VRGFWGQYEQYRSAFEEALERCCAKWDYRPRVLVDSMRYSLLGGGKRIRPVLFFATLDMLGMDWKRETECAVALECIHTYSLIHDDLPAMDNDDFRRGRPSNHKQFGEANAILAGDALLNEAFIMLIGISSDERHRRAAEVLARAAGADGMIGGQSLDLFCERNSEVGERELRAIYAKKTGKLIAAPILMAAEIADRNESELGRFGENLGVLFQLTDDILDLFGEQGKMGKTLGKDCAEDKLTCLKVYGTERSLRLTDEYADFCLDSLNRLSYDTSFLRNLVDYVRNRKN